MTTKEGNIMKTELYELNQEEINLVMDYRKLNEDGKTAILACIKELTKTPVFMNGIVPFSRVLENPRPNPRRAAKNSQK